MKHFLIRVSLVAALIGLCVSSSTAGRQNVLVNAVQERVYSNWTLLQSNRPPTPTIDSPLLRETLCGKKTTSLMTHSTGRIAGGSVATPNEYPWMVYLKIYTSTFSTYYYACGGTLISNQWILTSANCLEGAQSINVYLGAHDINSQNEWQRIMYTTTVYIKHPNWNSQTKTDDIALIKLPVAINYNSYIKSICLPSFDDPSHEGDTVFLTGWGRTSGYDINGPLSPTLRETTSTVISNAECSAVYGGSIINANTICSSGAGGKGICPSDNGGPMSYMTTDGNFVQIGVASFFSSTGCENGHPSGFTRIRNYLDWISTETGVTPNSAAMVNSICFKLVIALVLAIHYF